MKSPVLFAALAACVLAAATPVRADDRVERLYLDQVVPSADGASNVELYLRALTRYGEPISDLDSSDVVINSSIFPGPVFLSKGATMIYSS